RNMATLAGIRVDISSPPSSAAPAALELSGDRDNASDQFVIPGNAVSTTTGFMRGHGTFTRDGELIATLAGSVQQVNRLITVKPVKSRYNGEVGDVVVGRVVDVQQKRWKVDTSSRLDSSLLLSSVNLPGGELRRKSVEDELMMRDYLKEGDLISAEVQQVQHDGSLQLHTRNLKYGKLAQGISVQVPSYLIKRRKAHFHSLPCGAAVVIGCNGHVWIAPELREDADGGYNQDLEEVISLETRSIMARLSGCVRLLAAHCVAIYDTTIMAAFELSANHKASDLLNAAVATEIASLVVRKIRAEATEEEL
ncbi:exos-2, partial [Pristionchus pacificus]|uniref:S1 motif domain-containing protein n=1 Tax=Pristionchus pacificus TaxID=54126 RepID=A0A8R1V4R5_PRIPA